MKHQFSKQFHPLSYTLVVWLWSSNVYFSFDLIHGIKNFKDIMRGTVAVTVSDSSHSHTNSLCNMMVFGKEGGTYRGKYCSVFSKICITGTKPIIPTHFVIAVKISESSVQKFWKLISVMKWILDLSTQQQISYVVFCMGLYSTRQRTVTSARDHIA